MRKPVSLFAMLCLPAITVANEPPAEEVAHWLSKERFQIRARVINIDPEETSSTSLMGDVDAGDDSTLEVDFSYFLDDHWALELIAATTKHKMDHSNPSLDLGDVWILTPALTLQYHFNPAGKIRPYVGAGINYTFFYNEDTGANGTNINYDNSFGTVLQAGVDYGLDENWFLNADVKKIYLNTEAEVNYSVTADVDLNPWVFGLGVGYRF